MPLRVHRGHAQGRDGRRLGKHAAQPQSPASRGPGPRRPQTLDLYGRIVADVFVNDQNVAAVLKEEGYARRQ